MTFKRLLNVLRFGILKMSNISYLLISECHLCYKNNVLNLIMNEFYQKENICDRPVIIASSSVLLNEVRPKMFDKLQNRLDDLKESLNSSVYILNQELKNHKIQIISYKPTNKNLLKRFWDVMKKFSRNKTFQSIILHLEHIHYELGLFSVKTHLNDVLNQINREFHHITNIDFDIKDSILLNNKERLFIYYSRAKKLFKNIETELNKEFNLSTSKVEELSNKSKLLLSIINNLKNNGNPFNGIIIVNTKTIIPELCALIEKYEPWIKTINMHNFDYKNMESIENTIFITTRVLYDDMRIQKCKLIIDFDSLRTIDEYVLSLSKLCQASTLYSFTTNKQKKMRIIQYTYDYIERITQLNLSFNPTNKFSHTPIYKNQYGAVLSKFSSVDIVYQYIYRMPHLQAVNFNLIFQYERTNEGIKCQINFPYTSPLRAVVGEACKSKKEAKKDACFKAVIELEKYRLIDKNFRPEVYVDERYKIDHDFDKKKKREYEIFLPDVLYSNYNQISYDIYEAYLYEIQIPFESTDYDKSVHECYYGLILPRKLHDDYEFELDTASGTIHVKVNLICKITLNQLQMDAIRKYHKWEVLQIDPTLEKQQNVVTTSNKKYFLCLLTPLKEIHFDLMNLLCNLNSNLDKLTQVETMENGLNASNLKNKYLYDKEEIFPGEFINTKTKAKRTHIIVNYKVNPIYTFKNQKKKFIVTKLSTKDISHFYIHPLPGNVIDNFAFIPRIMNLIEIYSRSQHLIDDIGISLPYKIATECITSQSAQVNISYEKLEFIGDSYFKFLVCRYLSYKYPYMSNEDIDILLEYIIKNSFMFHYAKTFNLGKFINIDKWRSELWYPTEFDSTQNKTQKISDKMISDIYEALLGAYWIHGGNKAAEQFILKSGLSLLFEAEFVPFSGTNVLHKEFAILKDVEIKFGYTFQTKQYLIDAFTHPSNESNTISYSNQRTYMLGSSILELLVTYHYLHKNFKHFSPGISSILRAAAVNSSVRSYCCVKNGLHRYIIHNYPKFEKQIELYERYINSNKLSLPEIISLDVPFYLNEVIPSLLGAIYIDSNESLDAVYIVFDKIYGAFLREYINENLKLPVVPSQQIFEEFSYKCKCTKVKAESFSLKLSGYIGTKIIHKDKVIGVAFSHNEKTSKNLASLNALKNMEYIDIVCEYCSKVIGKN